MESLSPLAQALIDSMDDDEPIGGYAYDFVDDVHEEYKCCICLEVMKEPYQLVPCGHCCCRSCLGQLFRTFGVKSSCPIDRQAISMMFPDNNIKRKIQNLKIFCEKKNFGCQWKEELSQYQSHSSDCLYVNVLCSNEGCGEILQKALVEAHESSCRWRMVQCEDCNAKMHLFELVEHAGVCPFTELECPEGCGATLIRALVSKHMEDFCKNTIIECPWACFGCEYKESRGDIQEHLKKENHDNLLLYEMKSLKEAVVEIREKLNNIGTGCQNRPIEANKNLYFTWHLTPVSGIIQHGELRSPPFATGPHGYCFCLALLKRREDSIISIRMIPGLYDQFLPWPLKLNFSIVLLDQKSNDNPAHVKKIVDFTDFGSDSEIPGCYQRPDGNQEGQLYPLMNITNDTLESERYSANDGMFIVVKIKPYNFEENLNI